MRVFFKRVWYESEGVLSFEWVMLMSLLTIGVVSGIAAARDAIVDEFGDVAQAMLALDQSYSIDFPLAVVVAVDTDTSASDSSFIDGFAFEDDIRPTARSQEAVTDDGGSVNGPQNAPSQGAIVQPQQPADGDNGNGFNFNP